MIKFGILFGALVLMAVALVAGIASANPTLVLPWMCLSVPVAIWLGRASWKALPARRIAFVDEQTYQQIRRRRA